MKLMKKMGWEEGKGLGSDMSGQTEHIKVFKKSNNLGIYIKFKKSFSIL